MTTSRSLFHVKRFALALTVLASLITLGCTTTGPRTDEVARGQMLELLMPDRIQIVEPFTRIKSFDNDLKPDGIELLIQAVNSLENPGLMVVGSIRVELYEFVPGSADQKGSRLQQWDVELSTAAQQSEHWNQTTQMYEFRLSADLSKIPVAEKYVLLVSYHSPLGDHLDDESMVYLGDSQGATQRTPSAARNVRRSRSRR